MLINEAHKYHSEESEFEFRTIHLLLYNADTILVEETESLDPEHL